MSERKQPGVPEPLYWNLDEALCEATFFEERYTVRIQGHRAKQAYPYHRPREIVPISGRGTRDYVQVRPYILTPDFQLEMSLFPTRRGQQIGEVTHAEWTGMRHERIGYGQAWYYPTDHTLVLWELTLQDSYRQENPVADENLAALWLGFESFLIGQFPQTRTIATPSWEPLYEPQEWQRFLAQLGYQPRTPETFTKAVRPKGSSDSPPPTRNESSRERERRSRSKPMCKTCGKKDQVVLISYQRQWKGYECERCYEVVATIYETNENGKKIVYHPLRLNQE